MAGSRIFGTLGMDLFGAEVQGEGPPPGRYPEERIERDIFPVTKLSEASRSLGMRIASALFAAGVPGNSVIVTPDPRSSAITGIFVLERTIDQLPKSVLSLLGVDVNGAIAQVYARPISARELEHVTTPKVTKPRYGAVSSAWTPAIVIEVGDLTNLKENPDAFKHPPARY